MNCYSNLFVSLIDTSLVKEKAFLDNVARLFGYPPDGAFRRPGSSCALPELPPAKEPCWQGNFASLSSQRDSKRQKEPPLYYHTISSRGKQWRRRQVTQETYLRHQQV
ncbi:hypothetical protein DSO57_1002809 [Entomophthora muscae]|uniref:Uncharacterized protein n=1 Tax=Entomophthora muscae TaxID=34485 RepID=A0ACC2SAM0_9FUNG|nr:hypothetical protein DSO57_1002809 [Entomophthora muscae]